MRNIKNLIFRLKNIFMKNIKKKHKNIKKRDAKNLRMNFKFPPIIYYILYTYKSLKSLFELIKFLMVRYCSNTFVSYCTFPG